MGKAKRQQLQNPNYGRPGYSYQKRKAQVDFPHLTVEELYEVNFSSTVL